MLNGCVTTATGLGFTEADVMACAGRQSFERGLRYLDAITSLEVIGDQVIGTVRGTDDYLVVLQIGDESAEVAGGRPRAECGCPYGQEGFFCKHCVAVGLTVLRQAAAVPAQRSGRVGPSGERTPGGLDRPQAQAASGAKARPADLGSWLGSLSRDELILLVCEQAIQDDDWRQRLGLRAAGASADIPAVMTKAVDLLRDADVVGRGGLVGPYGYLEGQESWHYARRIGEVAAAVRGLAEVGHADDATLIAEQALAAVARTSRHASDRAGVIADATDELLAVHQQACRAAGSDPVRLADFVGECMLVEAEIPEIDLADYEDLLGEAGLARLRARVTAAWTANRSGWPERFAMERVLIAIADVDALVELLSANLDDRGLTHLRISAIFDEAGRNDEALAWAERGVREAAQPDPRLADFIVARYCSAGRIDDALAVRRDRFEAAPSVAAYESLKEMSKRAGLWESTRDWALGVLRAKAPPAHDSGGWPRWGLGPVLIDVLIADGDVDAAWESARGVASDAQWVKLADLVAETRPSDALAVYRRQIDMLRSQTGDGAYERMACMLASARECHRELGTIHAFDAYLRALRLDEKRKRRLIRILDAHQL